MENCLIQRLKASVNNSDLPLFDAVRIVIKSDVQQSAEFRISALDENDVRLSIPNGIALTRMGESSIVLTGNCYLPKDTKDSENWNTYRVSNTTGSDQIIYVYGVSRLKVFGSTAPSTGIVISPLDIKSLYNNSLVAILVSYELNVYGNFESFGRVESLKYIHINNSPVRGDLLKFISNAVKSGRTTGSINISSSETTVGTNTLVALRNNQTWQPSGNNYQVTYNTDTNSYTCIMDIDGNLIS